MKITRRQLRLLIKETADSVLVEAQDREEVHSAGVIIIDGDDVLVLRAYNNWGFPKGGVDPGESLLQAAIRETAEETTLLAGEDYVLTGDVAPSITYKSSKRDRETGKSRTVLKTATYFIATRTSNKQVSLPVSPELGRPAHDEWLWVSLSELSDPKFRVRMPSRLHPVMEYVGQLMTGAVL